MDIKITDTGHRMIEPNHYGGEKNVSVLLVSDADADTGLGLGFLRPRKDRRGTWEYLCQTPEPLVPLTAETLPERHGYSYRKRDEVGHPIQTFQATRADMKACLERSIKSGHIALTWEGNLERKAKVAKRKHELAEVRLVEAREHVTETRLSHRKAEGALEEFRLGPEDS